MRLPTQSDRLAEARDRLTYVQEDRYARVDLPAVRVAASWEPWHVRFQPHNDLPMHLVLMLIKRACPAWTQAESAAVARDVALCPLMEWPAILRAAQKSRSLATALDNLPARLFPLSSGGLLVGAWAVLALGRVGVTSLANLIVHFGLFKGTAHATSSSRPVLVGSALAGMEGGCAQMRLNDTVDLAATLTPDHSAYTRGVRQSFVAIAARAPATLTAVAYGTIALTKWNESDAYFRGRCPGAGPGMSNSTGGSACVRSRPTASPRRSPRRKATTKVAAWPVRVSTPPRPSSLPPSPSPGTSPSLTPAPPCQPATFSAVTTAC